MSNRRNRPISPHATIYRLAWAMAASFTHRLTGMALTMAGSVVLAWYLMAVASGPKEYAKFVVFASSWFGKFVLVGISWSLFQHLASGLRHLAFDLGYGFNLETARRTAIASFASSIILTALFWA
ncbi:succinate dehydrogenase, cytochrome b556 subunit [Bradyrhizobium jicamae]|uniref:succinate dehydrogenase, cytochrome b556 subunit n=1 Tax=Bradyrhizobium jicamae TaxID=280332 RepID=UPI0024C0D97B|nr:succinate dehydrogenase, cytochrome b556 subunit [Bradyrhizobium jicamae]